jgi:uncharacterized protein (DUF736 family)
MNVEKNRGVIFPNAYKEQDKHPDFKGKVNVEGFVKEVGVWKGEKNGKEYMSMMFSEPYQKEETPGAKGTPNSTQTPETQEEDDLPF